MFRFGFIWLFALVLLTGPSLTAQQVRVSEEEVEMQTRFIDANRERILGNYDKAIPIYEEILKKDEDNHAAAYELARAYMAQETFDKAVRYAKTAIDLEPANVWYQQFLAGLYQEIGQNEEAAKIYERLVKQEPEKEEYYYKWAYFLVRANEIDRAVKVYDQLESRIGVTEEVIRRKHALYLGMGDAKKAVRELERLIEAYPANEEYLHLLAGFFEEIGEKEKARETYQRILEADPDNAKAKLALAGNPDKSSGDRQYLESLKPVFRQPDVDIDLKIKNIMPLIRKVADTGDRELGEAALELTRILEEQHPGEAKAFAASADLLYHLGRRSEAIEKYRKTLELDDTVYLVWEQLLYALYEESDYAALQETAEEAMDFFPNKASAYYLYGVAANELGDQEDALNALQQALLMAGNDQRMTYNIQARLGLAYEALDDFAAAGEAFSAALSLNAQSARVLSDYSLMLARQGVRLDEAEEMAVKANGLQPDTPEFQDVYGWVLYKKKDFNKAKKWIGEALKNGGDENPRILEHYGDVLFQLDEQEAALDYWNKALENGSTSKLLEKKINDKQLYE